MRHVALACLLLLAAPLAAEPSTQPAVDWTPLPAPYGHQLEGRAAALEEAILTEAADSPADWAGRYYRGDGLGSNDHVVVAPTHGTLMTNSGCLGIYGLEHGAVERLGDGSIRANTIDSRGERGEHRWWPVVLEGRRYLVQTDEVVEFANGVNSGITVFLRWRTLATDEPEDAANAVPKAVASHLFVTPETGRIREAGESSVVENEYSRVLHAPVVIDIGRDDGAFVGMKVYVTDPIYTGEIVVTAVENGVSRGTFEHEEYADDTMPRNPEVGWTLSTRDPVADEFDARMREVANDSAGE